VSRGTEPTKGGRALGVTLMVASAVLVVFLLLGGWAL